MNSKAVYTPTFLEVTSLNSGDVITVSPPKESFGTNGFDGEVDTDF